MTGQFPINLTYRQVHSYFADGANRTLNVTMAKASTTALRRDPLYSQITMIHDAARQPASIPLVVLIVLNTRIYVAIRTRTQRLLTMSSKQRR